MIDFDICVPDYISERIINGKLCLVNQKKDEVWIYSKDSIHLWDQLKAGEIPETIPENNLIELVKSLYERDLIECRPDPNFSKKENLVAYNKTIQLGYEVYKAHTIYHAMLELTYRCNENCLHCYISTVPKNELTLTEIKNILNQLKELGCHQIHFTGGEVFCRDDFFEILEYSQSLGFLNGIFTNGTLLTSEKADRLSELYISFVKISLYGTTSKTHDKITRVTGSFNRSLDAIKYLRKNNIRVIIGFTLLSHNAEELLNAEKFCRELGAEHQIEMKIFPTQNNSLEPLEYAASEEDLKSFIKAGKVSPITKTICLAGQTKMKINPAGDVFPCEYWRTPVGNIRNHSLEELWNSEEMKKTVDWLKNYKAPKCEKCELINNCFVCPAYIDQNAGEFSNQFCKWAKMNSEINTVQI